MGRPTRRTLLAGSLGAGALGITAWRAGTGMAEGSDPVVDAKAITDWARFTYDIVTVEGLTPPFAARFYAYTQLAMAEALGSDAASWTRHVTEYTPWRRTALELDDSVVLTGAVATLIPYLIRGMSPASWQLLRLQEASVLAGRREDSPTRFEASYNAGVRIAQHVATWASTDGEGIGQGRKYQPRGDQFWTPTPPTFAPAIDFTCEQMRPMLLAATDEIKAPAPPSQSKLSDEAHALWSQELTHEQSATAKYWSDDRFASGTPSGHWLLIGAELADTNAWGAEQASLILSVLAASMYDAMLNCFAWKYRYAVQRPVTMVRRLFDPEWLPLLQTPPFPEWTSGHSVVSAAAATVLSPHVSSEGLSDVGRNPMRDIQETKRFRTLDQARDEAATSRVYGGIHYPSSVLAGKSQGQIVAQTILDRLAR